MIWDDLKEIIAKNDSFLISSHENPDGDSIGSQLAFYKYLKNIGKNIKIYNKDKPTQKFHFLPNCEILSDIPPNEKFDVLVILDCSNSQRTVVENVEKKFAEKIVNIDHHRDNSMFGDVNCVDVKAAATSQILYRFFKENNINCDNDMANCLLAGIMTDSGGFQFNNYDGTLYSIANDLIKCGADNKSLFRNLFTTTSVAAMKVRAKVWETLRFYENDKISIIRMPGKLYEEYGTDSSATEGMSNAVLGGEGIEVGIFLRYDENETHFSLRSAGKVDVGEIAAKADIGGGHKFAAGGTMKNVSYEEAIKILIERIKEKL